MYLYVFNILEQILEREELFNGDFLLCHHVGLHFWYADPTKLSSLCYLQVCKTLSLSNVFMKTLFSQGSKTENGCTPDASSRRSLKVLKLLFTMRNVLGKMIWKRMLLK